MARIGQKDTAPELVCRRLLHAMGYRFRLHVRKLPGTPDIVLARHHKIVLVHGCFWHGHEGCKRATIPETRHDWWAAKIGRNRERDAATLEQLAALGWDVLVVWQCETRDGRALAERLAAFMEDAAA
jgi:DNA mismatch endonuclease, patch repair protein